jgi:hypothetical protein
MKYERNSSCAPLFQVATVLRRASRTSVSWAPKGVARGRADDRRRIGRMRVALIVSPLSKRERVSGAW